MTHYQTIDLDEVRLHYAEAPGPGPALVLIHGLSGSNTSFLPLMPALAQQAHVYAPDLRAMANQVARPVRIRCRTTGVISPPFCMLSLAKRPW